MAIERNPGGDATGLLQSLRAQDGNSLLASANLGKMIRRFIAGALDAVARSTSGQMSRELGVATVQASCRYFARQMTGAVPGDYSLDGKWFSAGLAAHLRSALPATGSDEDVIAEAWASVANHVFEIVKLESEDEQKKAIDDLVRASLMLFSGMK